MLIKNYNMETFISDIDSTVQDVMTYMVTEETKRGCFNAYLIDYIWKLIQVKFSFMVQQLNWKVTTELQALSRIHQKKLLDQKVEHRIEVKALKDEIEAHVKKIREHEAVIEQQK